MEIAKRKPIAGVPSDERLKAHNFCDFTEDDWRRLTPQESTVSVDNQSNGETSTSELTARELMAERTRALRLMRRGEIEERMHQLNIDILLYSMAYLVWRF
jgi:hypothetical protein